MAAAASIVANLRATAFGMGGQQRVALEILARLPEVARLAPSRPLGGAGGHLWEQAVLPLRARGRLLWSPSATGPLLYPRQVATVHDTAFLDVPQFFAPAFARFYAGLVPRLARRAAGVVTVSEFSRRRLAAASGLKEEAIAVIGNGVAARFRPHAEGEIAEARAALGLPERYILLQATADRRKNLAGALAAWRLAAPRLDPSWGLVVSGDLGRAHVFGALDVALDAPRLVATGYVAEEHMGPLLAGAGIFLFPSLYEGFGLPVVEAMASGAPVIAGDSSALPEVAGDAAWLVDATRPEAIADAVVELAGDGRRRAELRRRGFARSRLFSWDEAAARYRVLFDRLG